MASMMEMESTIPIYEINGNDGKNARLKVHSCRNDKSMVYIVVGGNEYVVGASDLQEAIRRCAHY